MQLHIMLGTACNWKCKYCIQLKQAGFPQKMEEDFPHNLSNFISNNNLQIDKVDYWGGEPCLYFDQIKKIEASLPNLNHRSRFVTNGSLLTSEIVDYLNKHNFYVNLSYHEGQLSEEGWKLALQIKRLHVTSLIHAKCLTWEPYRDKWQWVHQHFGRCINWYPYPLCNVQGVGEYKISKDHIDQHIDYLYSILPKAKTDVFYFTALKALFHVCFDEVSNHQCACFNSDVLSIDTLGNQYICHHACDSRFSVGNIFKDGLSNVKLNTLKPKCKDCKHLPYCQGGCFRETDDVSCYFLHKLYDLKQQYLKVNA